MSNQSQQLSQLNFNGEYDRRQESVSMDIGSNPIESTSRPVYQVVSTSVPSMDSNQLESVINNYNRICSQLPQNGYNDWLQSFYNLMKSEWTRVRSFYARQNTKWTLDFVTPEELANAGFFFLNGDRVQCAFCRGIVSRWERGDSPLSEHARHFPRCPFIMEEDVGNQPIGDDPIRGPKNRLTTGHDVCGNYSPMQMINNIGVNNRNGSPVDMKEYGVQPHRGPKNPNYKSIDSRRRSYSVNGWDSHIPVSIDTLSEAGFYSIGMSDYVKCFYCDGGLCNWELGDDPWVEHSKWFPDCQFVSLNKSQTFIEECKKLAEIEKQKQSNPSPTSESDPEVYSSESEDESIDALGVQVVNQWMNSDIVIQLIDLNAFPIEVIKAVLNKRWYDERQPFPSFAHLYDAVSQWRTPPTLQNTEHLVPNIIRSAEINSISSEEEYNSGTELPSSQSSISSTTSTISSCSTSPVESSEGMMCSESSPKEDNRLLCKICLDREIGVVFLPCGHQLACTQCAPCVTDCPICRKVIRGTVRTFFS